MSQLLIFAALAIFVAILMRKKRHRPNRNFKPKPISRSFSRNPNNKGKEYGETKMSVANVVMFEFETKADLENWADWYKNDGPFPNNEISLFVQTGETSAIGIATYPSEEAREAGGKSNPMETIFACLFLAFATQASAK